MLREGLELGDGVTFVVGENGSGKSTLLEGIAGAFGLGLEGGDPQHPARDVRLGVRPPQLAPARRAGRGVVALGLLPAGRDHARLPHVPRLGRRDAIDDPWFHELSHGESTCRSCRKYLGSPGFYCLDEPETALSFSSTLALVATLQELASTEGAQVLCATHSPLITALPGATILEVGEWGIRETTWDDLVLVANWRSYLTDPHRYLRRVLAD